MKRRRLKRFTLGMIIYISIALIGIVSFDIFVWKSLEKYQKNYEKAVNASNPDDFMRDWIEKLDYNMLMDYLSKDDSIIISPYEDKENVYKFISDKLLFDGKITFKRDSKWSEMAPVYNLLSEGKEIAVLSVTRTVNTYKNEVDKYDVRKVVFGNYVSPLESVRITLKDRDSLYINGIIIKDDYRSFMEINNEALTLCSQYCGDPYKVVTYVIDGLYESPQILVKDSEDVTLLADKDNDYSAGLCKGFVNEVTDIASQKVFDYMKYYNVNVEYKDYIDETLVDTPMRNIVNDVKSGLKWREKAIEMTLKSEAVNDIVCYNKDAFSATVELSYYMKYEKYSKNEAVKYNCVFARKNDKWYIIYISVI